MSENSSTIVSKVWGMCNPLRDDGLSYGDYLEQLTYLIFLKMSDEYAKPPYKKESGIPAGYTWQDMNTLTGAALEEQYKDTLEKLGEQGGIQPDLAVAMPEDQLASIGQMDAAEDPQIAAAVARMNEILK